MRNPAASIKKIKIATKGENKISIIVGSLIVVAVVSIVILGSMFPATIISLEILRWSALSVLTAIMWRDVFNAMDIEESKQHNCNQHSL